MEQGVKSATVCMLTWENQTGRSSPVWPQLFLQALPPLPELVDPLDLLIRLWGPHGATDNQRSQPHNQFLCYLHMFGNKPLRFCL